MTSDSSVHDTIVESDLTGGGSAWNARDNKLLVIEISYFSTARRSPFQIWLRSRRLVGVRVVHDESHSFETE
jgi:hypothetical protein